MDNDEFLCVLASPPLSSVRLPLERMGYEAAALLDRLMAGRAAPSKPAFLPPVDVITRQSTDSMAVSDVDVRAALQFMRDNAHRPFKIEQVAEHVRISRRSLEHKFQRTLGRSPLRELRRIQLERARNLLVTTSNPIASIAHDCGFGSMVQFWSVFKKELKSSPTKFRARNSLTHAGGAREKTHALL